MYVCMYAPTYMYVCIYCVDKGIHPNGNHATSHYDSMTLFKTSENENA
jgi:hypothetical protein